MFQKQAAGNQITALIYVVVAIVLVISDHPLGAATMFICAELSSLCAAVYATAGRK